LNIPSTKEDPNYRYKMDAVIVTHEGKDNKTLIRNISNVCQQLHVPIEWLSN